MWSRRLVAGRSLEGARGTPGHTHTNPHLVQDRETLTWVLELRLASPQLRLGVEDLLEETRGTVMVNSRSLHLKYVVVMWILHGGRSWVWKMTRCRVTIILVLMQTLCRRT